MVLGMGIRFSQITAHKMELFRWWPIYTNSYMAAAEKVERLISVHVSSRSLYNKTVSRSLLRLKVISR